MGDAIGDVRFTFVKERLRAAFPKVSSGKFEKAFDDADNKAAIFALLDEAGTRSLVFSESLRACAAMPRSMKGKLIHVVKVGTDKVPEKSPAASLMFSEVGSSSSFEHLQLIANEVFLPVLSNPYNQERWGEVPTREIMERFHGFLSSTTILCGQIRGETRLPMPPLDVLGTAAGKNRISLLEGAIITWTKQIKNVLKQDPEGQLKQGMHPTPDVEIEFWKSKAQSLNSVFEQLQGQRIRRVLRALDASNSTYCQTFSRLCKEVFTARLEANDNVKYLRTLEAWCARLSATDEFQDLLSLFKPVMHTILLIWKNSKHYNTPARLVVLMREICNSLINQACRYINGSQIFRLIENEQAELARDQLRTTLKVCSAFKNTYFDYKATANAECPANTWRIQNNALFMRLDGFLERCHDILDLVQTIVQFSRLARVEVGGTKGKYLSASVEQIHGDFQSAVEAFKAVPYDIMDVGAKQFDDDFFDFRRSVRELERRLGAVVSLAFDDCATVYGRFKLLDSFEGLLDRPIIQDELEKKYVGLVQAYGADLKVVQGLFLRFRDQPLVPWNLPPIAGALAWCRGLVERIRLPMVKLEQLDRTIMDREETKEVLKVHSTIIASLQEYEKQKIEEWGRDVASSSEAKLRLPLLLRDPQTRALTVNFDAALVRLLREVRYFLLLGLDVPDRAREIYRRVVVFRRWKANLDLIVNTNNDILRDLLPVEKPLLESHMQSFDRVVERGIAHLNWQSEGVDEYISESRDSVDAANNVLRTMKGHLASVEAMLQSWDQPLMERKPKPVEQDELERLQKALRAGRYDLIKSTGKEIFGLISKDTNKVLRVSNACVHWRAYLNFVNNVIVDSLARVVTTSLSFLHRQIDGSTIEESRGLPLLEVRMELAGHRVSFSPPFHAADGKDLRGLVDGWIGSFFHVATLTKRLDRDGTFMREMHMDSDVCALLGLINNAFAENEESCNGLRDTFEQYSYLWLDDLDGHFRAFRERAVVTLESGQTYADLAAYDAEIRKYEEVGRAIDGLESPQDVGWLRINALPVQSALRAHANRWCSCFTRHLEATLVEELERLDAFMRGTISKLDVELREGDDGGKQDLLELMKCIADVRKSQERTKELFAPLQDTIQLLKAHGTDVSALTASNRPAQEYLDEVPMIWDSVLKRTYKRKEEIMPLQTREVEDLKERLAVFAQSVRDFRFAFKDGAPFAFRGAIEDAYGSIQRYAEALAEKEAEARRFNEEEDLFELQISKHPQNEETRSELNLLKSIWDYKAILKSTFEAWNHYLWNEIDTEALEDLNKASLKQLRAFGEASPAAKGWQVYRDVEASIKDMNVVLPLVNSLHSDAMRDRHWSAVARACQVKHVDPSNSRFTFEDMLKLDIHEHADDVSDIVDTAQKELKIENKLRVIEGAWAELILDYVPHRDTEMLIIKPSEDVVESLEAHQMELQTMIGMGKFVDFFRDRVMHWQRALGNVEEVLKVWRTVSHSWAALESIFLASADIRAQLPDDTKRFEGIDSEFKELMKDAVTVPNCVQACAVEGRMETLKSMVQRLEMCQKSLNEYLDLKKKIFPRFYFVSQTSLLDMLANGTNPPRIMPYLNDCYPDALCDLRFVASEDGSASTRTVNRMISKDGEGVDLYEEFTLEGEVECYLNRLTDAMNDTLKHELADGLEKAIDWEVDKPRHRWLFDYPAQVVLTGTQIYWTEETESALEEFEGGQEDAVKRYLDTVKQRLSHLIALVLGELSRGDRTKIISLITMDVHSRDVVAKLVADETEGPMAFEWQKQLRFYKEPNSLDVDIKITDFRTKYFYEWIGNTGRLVITPLTDRCYITLTMALRLFLGGAPAGPAGTGKTETTKDLARALALPCYVFNCSDQMNYQTMGDIFRGLAQTGAWGCFDEFNRIRIEVLSVVATQVKSVQDAIVRFAQRENREPEFMALPEGTPPTKVGTFSFMNDTISLVPTCGFFITMNPGYAGRTELPENLKVLFRSCAMIRPDLKPICENMLMSEGFQTAATLAVKFVTLYKLSSELLSKQAHYDWGLRAVKSVLRVAGRLKRAEPGLNEAQILMRALRDFNTPKIPANDTPIFMRLINDLFMGLDVPAKVNEELRRVAAEVTREMGLQAEEQFILKVLQFEELLQVRHSVMLLGPTGSGKTQVWRALQAAINKGHPKKVCVAEPVNPKSVTGDELYGYMTLAKEWKDGVLSIIMRAMSKNFAENGFYPYQTSKWVVLDGDIDAVWIESMNTVMDDNKVLTLVSNERVPLSDAMRMVFEINSLKNATPATVSRAGILYINEADIGWRPMVDSWIATRASATERRYLPGLFDKYVEAVSEMVRRDYKLATPLRTVNKVSTIIYLLEALVEKVPDADLTAEVLENYFSFAVVWAFGGPMAVDKLDNFRRKFSDAYLARFPGRYPKDGDVFDFRYDHEADACVPWEVPEYAPIPIGGGSGETPFSQLCVSTVESERLTFLMDRLARHGRCMMLVGAAGSGKSTIIREYLRSLDKDADGMMSSNISMSYYTDSFKLQSEMELPIEKRSGRVFGPPPTKKMVFFVDDLNLPFVETYGTQSAIALLTQHMAYGTIFDRADLGFRKEIVDVQYLAAMNPTAGSFEICERGQRHFATFGCAMPGEADLVGIYSKIFTGHLQGFEGKGHEVSERVANATVALHSSVARRFLPSAIKFTYNWNMRELTNIFQGLTLAEPDASTTPLSIFRLWAHECSRVFADRLLSEAEIEGFRAMMAEVVRRELPEPVDAVMGAPLPFTRFASKQTGRYAEVESMDSLRKVLDAKLAEYNENFAMMDLVLFEQALEHVCRIARIVQNPSGNAMLVGVGGSGKQSLSRLAAYISGMEVRQLQVTSTFKVEDLKEELRAMFRAAGVKGTPTMFLMTDAQIVDDRFLIYINALLATGWISDLFPREELDGLLGSLRGEAKAAGVPDNPDAMLDFFVSRLRANLHTVLAFSPVGDVFRVRARRFPGLVSSTVINFFHPWPREALESVAFRNLGDVDLGGEDVRGQLATHMAGQHLSVTAASARYKASQGRYNYVTPKSYLQLITFYKYLLGEKRAQQRMLIDRLDVGLATLLKTAKDVEELKEDLVLKMEDVAQQVASTDRLIAEMGAEQEKAQEQQAAANVEAEKAGVAAAAAAEIEAQAAGELAQAEPAMKAAAAAVDVLDKDMLRELKTLSKPPPGVDLVTNACLILVNGERNPRNLTWDNAKKMMANVDQFKQRLKVFRGEDIPEDTIQRVMPYMENELFTVETMTNKSKAAGNLVTWIINIVGFNRIYVKVKPLMDSLQAAQSSKAAAEASLRAATDSVAEVMAKLARLEDKFKEATEEKLAVETMAQDCRERKDLAERLVNGLASENERWGREIEVLKQGEHTLVGDCMLAAGFVSYVGAFDKDSRDALWSAQWSPDLAQRSIPLTPGVDPLAVLTDEANNAKMISEGLPADRISIENGAIITSCERWPLIIDPQVQGIKWLKRREEANGLQVIQLTARRWLTKVVQAITSGNTVIIENLGEDIDATLEPVLSRAIYKKGRQLKIKIGGEEVEYDSGFRLYLQTKLSNPHYKPEVAAQCTLINFIATERGLEDQLLAKVVGVEKPELEAQAQELQASFQRYKMELLELENDLLTRLANAPDDILGDVPLIESLEATKESATRINAAVTANKETEVSLNAAREHYRPQASEGAMLYFLLTKLCGIDHMYQYSLDSFVTFFYKSIERAAASEDQGQRVQNLRESLRLTVYTWVSRGLFERHKLILAAQLTFNLMRRGILGEDRVLHSEHVQFLLRGPKATAEENPIPWLPDDYWRACRALSRLEGFGKFCTDLVDAAPRFREWFNHTAPESEKLPLDWAALDRAPFQKMLVVRCLRPDRVTSSLSSFIRATLPNGGAYTDCDATLSSFEILEQSYLDSTPATPVYFILSPGANVVGDLDRLADRYGFVKGASYHNVSMGQGQDVVAMQSLEAAHRNGHWVILNNIHLMPRWLGELEKKLDVFIEERSHPRFRLFVSSDPARSIPIGVLNRCIKLTNEPPAGLKANLKRAFASFSREQIEEADSKQKSIIFGLCHFHAIMIERKMYGPMGFNMKYPFGVGDLINSSECLANYMEKIGGGKIPWQDLKYIFGEIMYGGHIVNDNDRLLANCYLDFYMRDELLDEMEMYPFAEDEKGVSFTSPSPTTWERYIEHIEATMTSDTPIAFGLHPNAEIEFRSTQSGVLCETLLDLQTRHAGGAEESLSPHAVAERTLQAIQETLQEKRFDVEELVRGLVEQGPYQNVFIQEMEAMNRLLAEITRSLRELQQGLAGELTMSEGMEDLQHALFDGRVPGGWARLAWASMRDLAGWLADFQERLRQLEEWQGNPLEIPKVTWISGLVNPQSFLTAVCQVTAQRKRWELDRLVTSTVVTKKMTAEQVDAHDRDGAHVIGMAMQGGRWDTSTGTVEKSRPKEMFCPMPIITVRAVDASVREPNIYHCPIYKTRFRGPTFVAYAQLKTSAKSPPARWVLAGVAMLMDRA